jgi:mannitol-1-phosphate 5-dehydrogenase
MKAVHFGAGNIGRGFIGLLLHKSGYELVFADVVPDLVAEINRRHGYRVLTLGEEMQTERVEGVRAVTIGSTECVREVMDADLVTTAVGIANLDSVAEVIAAALRELAAAGRTRPLNIMACENALFATNQLREAIWRRLDAGTQAFAEKIVGFANVAVDRIAPNQRPQVDAEPLDAVVEAFFEWDIERRPLKGDVHIEGAHFVDELGPYLERKLFLLNGAHAIVAYLGYLRGYRRIDEAVADPQILTVARGAQAEMARALSRKHPQFSEDELAAYAERVLARFRNPHLGDEVVRVGRDPLRKLGANDRLVAPLRLCQSYEMPIDHLIVGIAAGYRFDAANDAAAQDLQQRIRDQGLSAVIRQVSGIGDEETIRRIIDAYEKLKESV